VVNYFPSKGEGRASGNQSLKDKTKSLPDFFGEAFEFFILKRILSIL
jgi:hypothetical protein